MANSIADLSVKVGLDQKALEHGLDKLPKTIESKMPNAAMHKAGTTNGMALKAGLIGGVAGGIAGAITSILATAASAGMAAVEKIFNEGLTRIQELGETTDFAAALGYSTESIARIQGITEAAGIGTDQAIKSLARLDDIARKALEGDDTAMNQFKTLGIDASKFISLPLDKKIEEISEALKGSGDKIAMNAALMDIFGEKVGIKFLGVLSKSAEDLTMLADHGGKTASELNVLAVTATRIKDVFGQLGDTWDAILIQLSPILSSIGDLAMTILPKLTEGIGIFGGLATPMFRELALLGADLADIVVWIGKKLNVVGIFIADLLTKFKIFSSAIKKLKEDVFAIDPSTSLRAKLEKSFSESDAAFNKRLNENKKKEEDALKNKANSDAAFAIEAAKKKAEKELEIRKKNEEEWKKIHDKLLEESIAAEDKAAEARQKQAEEMVKEFEEQMKQYQAEIKHMSSAIQQVNVGSVEAATKAAENKSGINASEVKKQTEIQREQLKQLRIIAAKEAIELGEF